MIYWSNLKKVYDTNDYYNDLINFPNHIKKALNSMKNFDFSFNPKTILVCGMGGSAIPGYLLKNYCFFNLNLPVEVVNSYDIPKLANKKTLTFIISYSGNTEEALSCLKQALAKNLKIILISSDGLLKEIAEKHKITFIQAPLNFQPRAATPFLFTYLLEVLRKLGLISPNYNEAIKELKKINLSISKENIAKKIALGLLDKFIFIYVPFTLYSVGRRLQSQDFNENSKMLAKYSVVPESNHNELSAWDECQEIPFSVLFINDPKASNSIKKRMKFTKNIIKRKASVFEINAKGNSLLSRLLTPIYIGDMISYYLSLLRHKNPLPVRVVQELKAYLSNETSFKKNLVDFFRQ